MDCARCTGCGVSKSLSEFYGDKTKASGRRSICKRCDLDRAAERYRRRTAQPGLSYRPHRSRPVEAARPCATCGEPFIPDRNRGLYYCGRDCFNRRGCDEETKPCEHCGVDFTAAVRLKQRFCGVSCASSWSNQRRRRAPTKVVSPYCCKVKDRPTPRTFICHLCPGCGDAFLTKSQHGRCCTPLCTRRVDRRLEKDRRRVIRNGTKYHGPVNRQLVYDRDDWTCQLCGVALNGTVEVPHPDAPTLDHCVPLSLGGEHRYENVQAAHFRCNVAKGDRITQLSFAA